MHAYLRLLFVAAVLCATPVAGRAQSPEPTQTEDSPDWEPVGPVGPVGQLIAPRSGALFARTLRRTSVGSFVADDLLRSDDGGDTWTGVDLPPDVGQIVIDPSNHTVMYADQSMRAPNGALVAGLLKTSDDAATWQPLSVPQMAESPSLSVLRLVVSPADASVLYLALGAGSRLVLVRSLDGGATWTTLQTATVQASCNWGVSLLRAHPTDPARVFRSQTCGAGFMYTRPDFAPLEESRDQGATWQRVFAPRHAFPVSMVGGEGAQPARLFLLEQPLMGSFPGSMYRSDDDGMSWDRIFQLEPVAESVQLVFSALALDPDDPDHLYASWTCPDCGVQISLDAGASWAPFGRQDIGRVHDLVLGIDRLNVYAATDQGVWRMSLAGPAIPYAKIESEDAK